MSCFGFIVVKQLKWLTWSCCMKVFEDMWKCFMLRKIIPKNLVGMILPTIMHRAQKTNGCSRRLRQPEAWLKCGPSWMVVFHLDSHAYPPTLLPMWTPTFPLNGCFYSSKKRLSGGFGVEFSIDGGSLMFPLFPEEGQYRFPAQRCFTGSTLFSDHVSSISAEVLSQNTAWHQSQCTFCADSCWAPKLHFL